MTCTFGKKGWVQFDGWYPSLFTDGSDRRNGLIQKYYVLVIIRRSHKVEKFRFLMAFLHLTKKLLTF